MRRAALDSPSQLRSSSPRLELPALLLVLVQVPAPVDEEPAAVLSDDQRRFQDRPIEALGREQLGWLGRALLGWTDARDELARRGLHAELIVAVDATWAATGGAAPEEGALRGVAELGLTLDTAAALGLEGGTLFAGVQWIEGEDGSLEQGVLQPTSSLDAEERLQLARVWYEQVVGGDEAGGTRVRLGKMDANSLFAASWGGAYFVHSSPGLSPTLLGIPTYPDPAFGVVVAQPVAQRWELRVGLFDGALQRGVRTGLRGPRTWLGSPSDAFAIVEAELAWGSAATPGRVALGGWLHTGDFPRFDGGAEDGTEGLHLVLDQRLRVAGRPLDAFLQLGSADRDVSLVATHVGAGLVAHDLLLPERRDAAGLAVSVAGLADGPPGAALAHDETAVELFYGYDALPWLRLKPVLHWVHDPGGRTDVEDLWILGVRTTVSL